MLVTRQDIMKFLPHRPPVVMVDEIIETEGAEITTSFTPDRHNIFCENGFFTEWGVIENMAQTAAVKAGYEAQMQGLEPQVGFIGAIKNFEIHQRVPVDNKIQTHLQITAEVMQIKLARVSVFLNQNLLATCELKIFLQE